MVHVTTSELDVVTWSHDLILQQRIEKFAKLYILTKS